jgi:cytochrome d ubiquinol oxidase subunit I
MAGAVSGLAAIVAMECGWVVTEVGRQPWVVYQLQTTAAAAATDSGIVITLSIIGVGYAILGVTTVLILRMLGRRWRRSDRVEAAVPHGSTLPEVHAAEAAF